MPWGPKLSQELVWLTAASLLSHKAKKKSLVPDAYDASVSARVKVFRSELMHEGRQPLWLIVGETKGYVANLHSFTDNLVARTVLLYIRIET